MVVMPPKNKMQHLSAKAACIAREKLKNQRLSDAMSQPVELSSNMTSEATESATLEVSSAEILSNFFDDWVKVLDKDDKKVLGFFLVTHFQLKIWRLLRWLLL